MRVERRRAQADGHPLGEERVPTRARDEVAPRRAHDAVVRRDAGEHAQARPARPPELVRIRVQHPVGAVLGRRQPGHARHPLALAEVVPGLADQVEAALALVPFEHLRRPVLGAVVRRDHEVDAGGEVERDLRVDDVCLVPDEERHDELHRGTRLDGRCHDLARPDARLTRPPLPPGRRPRSSCRRRALREGERRRGVQHRHRSRGARAPARAPERRPRGINHPPACGRGQHPGDELGGERERGSPANALEPRGAARRTAGSPSTAGAEPSETVSKTALPRASSSHDGAAGLLGRPRVRLLRIEADPRERRRHDGRTSQAWSGWSAGSREEHRVGAGEGGLDRGADVVLVTVALVVDAPEREPGGARAQDRAGAPVLVTAPRGRPLSVANPARPSQPGGSARARVEREDGERARRRRRDAPGGDRGPSERTASSECGETTTIFRPEERRHEATMIAALSASWRRFVPSSARRRFARSAGRTSTGAGAGRPTSATCGG